VVLLNNAAYGIEVALHDGPYNYFQNWSYAKLLGVFSNGDPNANVHGFCVNTRYEYACCLLM
jgi:TPP-dependent 2-oxoacid decarboxylase